MQPLPTNFRYLNRSGKWLDFYWSGLELAPDGALQLRAAPRFSGPAARSAAESTSDGPGGIAADDAGRIFYAVPGENRILTSGGCDPGPVPLLCLSERPGLGPLNAPRGLLLLRKSERLVLVDSGNHRLLFCDLVEFNVREVWGQANLSGQPAVSDAADGFDTPWSIATDRDEQDIYVLDFGNTRILKFARTRDADIDFAERVNGSGLLQQPSALTVSGTGEQTRVFVADLVANAIFVFDRTGSPVFDSAGVPAAIRWPGMGNIVALAASESALYVGDNDQRRILSFDLTDGFPFNGEAAGFKNFVTALTIAEQSGALLVHTGGADQPLSLELSAAYLDRGVLWSGAISGGPASVSWSRLRAWVGDAAGTHAKFYYAISDKPAAPAVDPNADQPFSARWQPLPDDADDFLLSAGKARFLFVGAQFLSDRTATPRLTQMRADFDTDSFAKYLPAIYRQPRSERAFFSRFISLFQGLFEDIEDEVVALERYFDPFAAPVEALPWLATWLAVTLQEGEPEARMRASIASAFRRYQWRGTITGLRLALLEDAGVHAVISEPITAGSFMLLTSARAPVLGLGTRLSSAEPGGPVLSGSATLGRSYLITDREFGEPVFADAAYQFVVEVHRHEANTDARLHLIEDIIEREKPAHTMHRIVLIDPTMRVGAQARVGIDTVVAGEPAPGRLGESGGDGLRLAGASPPRIGTSRLGNDLKL